MARSFVYLGGAGDGADERLGTRDKLRADPNEKVNDDIVEDSYQRGL